MKCEMWKKGILVPVERPMEQAKGCCRLTDLGQLVKEGLFWLDRKQLDRKAEKPFVAEKCVLIDAIEKGQATLVNLSYGTMEEWKKRMEKEGISV